jgi:hypothetical protein
MSFIKIEPQQQTNLKSPSYEELCQIEKTLFGESDSTSEQLEWAYIRKDNFMVRTLKQAVESATYSLEQQVKKVEKDIKKAGKVYNGR